MRMKCMRIFPEMWASTLWPFSSSTRNIAFGSGSITVPSTWTPSSLGKVAPSLSAAHGAGAFRCALSGERKNLRRLASHRDRVLEVGRPRTVARHHGPVVGQRAHLRRADGEH